MAQPYKGPRKQLATRVLRTEAEQIEQRAKRMGLTVSEYLRCLALRELEDPTFETRQEALDVSV